MQPDRRNRRREIRAKADDPQYADLIGEFPDFDTAKAEADRRRSDGEVGFLITEAEPFDKENPDDLRALWGDDEVEAMFATADAAGQCPCGAAMPSEN